MTRFTSLVALAALLATAMPAGVAPAAAAGTSRDLPAVVRGNTWYLPSTLSGNATWVFDFGRDTDIPVFGDWDGDGTPTPGVYRDGLWLLANSRTATGVDISFVYGGREGDIPIVGDWDGDGQDTAGIVRDGTWHLRNLHRGGPSDVSFDYGRVTRGDVPLVGDWDGDGIDTAGIVRDGTWHLRNVHAGGSSDLSYDYGRVTRGDVPLTGDWNADGTDTPGIVRDDSWYLVNRHGGGSADVAFGFGRTYDWFTVQGGSASPGHEPGFRNGGQVEPPPPPPAPTPRQPGLDGSVPDATLRRGSTGQAVLELERRLRSMGYWLGAVDGTYDHLTEQAVMAFQGYERISRDGVYGPNTRQKLLTATRPVPRSTSGTLIEIDKPRQIMFFVRDGRTHLVFHTSTGTETYYTSPSGQRRLADTPPGRWRITWRYNGWRQSELGRLYRPAYWHSSGIAIHGYHSVPPYPASHGCTRVTIEAMDYLWANRLVDVGTPVWTY